MSESNRDYFARLTGGLSLQMEEEQRARITFSNKRDQEMYDLMRGPIAGPMDEAYHDARGRIAALVALCEELLAEHASTLSIAHELFGPLGPMLDEIATKTPEYRARLAQLKGS